MNAERTPQVWLIRAGGDNEDYYEENIELGLVGLGWPVPDLREFQSREDLHERYSDEKEGRIPDWLRELWNLRSEVRVGDLVVMPEKGTGLVALGLVTVPNSRSLETATPGEGVHSGSVLGSKAYWYSGDRSQRHMVSVDWKRIKIAVAPDLKKYFGKLRKGLNTVCKDGMPERLWEILETGDDPGAEAESGAMGAESEEAADRHGTGSVDSYALGADSDTLDESLEKAADELLVDVEFLQDIVELLEDKGQVILYGPPGTGKTYLARKLATALAAEEARRALLQFHPSTSYEDFFEGYRPAGADSGGIRYELTPGPLARMAERAAGAPDKRHVMIIDEINRGNLPRVLGELLFLLEYRNESVQTLYRAEKPFRLPGNLWFIGTMNTADRSIALVDAALRRRFHFVRFFPDSGPMKGLLSRWLRRNRQPLWVGELVDAVNGELKRALEGSHLLLGPSHFMKDYGPAHAGQRERLRRIWEYDIEPFIEDQFFGDPEQIARLQFDGVWNRHGLKTVPGVEGVEGADSAGSQPPAPPSLADDDKTDADDEKLWQERLGRVSACGKLPQQDISRGDAKYQPQMG